METQTVIETPKKGKKRDRPVDAKFAEVFALFEGKLRQSDLWEVGAQLEKRFSLGSAWQGRKRRNRKRGCLKNPGLSNTQKRILGLHNIGRNELKYKEILPMNEMWKSYMEVYLGLKSDSDYEKFNISHPHYEEAMQQLFKADFHGAFLRVIRSTISSLVGLEGILVLETKNMFKLLGKDDQLRSISKVSCEFSLHLGNFEVSFLGKNFLAKPSDRSIKKLKRLKFISF